MFKNIFKKKIKDDDSRYILNKDIITNKQNKSIYNNSCHDADIDEIILSSILGFVVGDALGVPVEFKSRDFLKSNPVINMIGHGTHNMPKGTWSDDTSMILATIDSIVECSEINYEDIMNKFCEWRDNAKYTATNKFFDIGIATSKALNNYKTGINPLECGGKEIYDNGNGSLMRILPFVLFAYYKDLKKDEQVNLINNASSLTHAHEISKLGCQIYADFTRGLLEGKCKVDALNDLQEIDYSINYSKDNIKLYQKILSGLIKFEKEEEIKSSGFIVDTLEASIWCIMTTDNFKDAVLKAINLGADTDTIGAITGSLAGVIYGYNSIPKEWLDTIQNLNYVLDLCKNFIGYLHDNTQNI